MGSAVEVVTLNFNMYRRAGSLKTMYSLICVAVFIASVNAGGEVTIIHRPSSISLKGNERLDQSLLKEIYAASLGFTTKGNSDWSGLRINNPFHFAEGIVTLYVDGIESFGSLKGHHFPLNVDEDPDVTWYALERRIKNRFPTQNTTLARVRLSDGLSSIASFQDADSSALPKVQFLNVDVSEDKQFLSEVALLEDIVQKVKSNGVAHDGIPDFYWFELLGLHAVRDLHGADSDSTQEALKLLRDTVVDMNKAFNSAYKGKVLVSVLTSDASHTRQTRSLKAENNNNNLSEVNLAADYDENWPVQFNICLWFMVAFVMALIACSISFLEMDPGRDSIIYRMTSMKSMKKDN